MNIKHIAIKNFRNITSADYDLGKTNTFVGTNHIGKTNSILAVYWLLTGYMLNGDSNDQSLKNIANPREVVSVEATFEDGWKFRKDYYEKWTTAKGTATSVYSGNNTDYFINGVKNTNKYVSLSVLTEHLGIKETEVSTNGRDKINFIQAITNPLYLTEQIEWQLLRKLIISLVGDAKPEDIFKTHPELEPCHVVLSINMFDDGRAKKSVNSEIINLKSNNEFLKSSICEYSTFSKPDEKELAEAKEEIVKTDWEIENSKPENAKKAIEATIKEMRESAIQQYNEEQKQYSQSIIAKHAEIESKINAKKLEANEVYTKEYNEYQSIISKNSNDSREAQNELDQINASIDNLRLKSIQKKSIEADIESSKKDIEFYKSKIEFIRSDEWYKKNSNVCPNCGYVLNKSSVDSLRTQQECVYSENIEKAKSDISKYENSIAELNSADSGKDYDSLLAQKTGAEAKVEALNSGLPFNDNFAPSATLNALNAEIDALKAKLTEPEEPFNISEDLMSKKESLNSLIEQNKANDEKLNAEYESKKKELEERKAKYVEIQKKETNYNFAQNQIKCNNAKIDSNNAEIGKKQNIIEMIMKYSKIRLETLDRNVKTVFGDKIRFRLLKENINGSWEADCTPYIVGSDIEYWNGSPSEKLITSFAIMERVKSAMNEPNLPIIIDDCEKLDDFTLANSFRTGAQIIMAKVDSRGPSDKVKLIVSQNE